jgi:hypothetical protein
MIIQAHALPVRQVILPPDEPGGEPSVQFRLTYEGSIPAAMRGHANLRQEIRKVFHKQLRQFWNYNPFFQNSKPNMSIPRDPSLGTPPQTRKDQLAERFSRCGYRFVPVVTDDLDIYCSLDILFLRPEAPGKVLLQGDLDNRVKSIIDALRMPKDTQELGDYQTPGPDENPFFVLMEDDRLLTQFSVETDMLLEPTRDTADKLDSRLVIKVGITPHRSTWSNAGI